jgi:hypothetical protein|tara:strand:- start:536 stop:1066 length:531 start_codon:yes stop_codon:yes gene_type:complete
MDEQDAARAFDLAARKTRVGGKSTKLKLNFPRKGEVVAAGATSRFRGVSWLKARAKWHAQITINKKQTHLGCFTDEADAGRAYDAAARRYRNVEEDKLNFPHDTVAPHLLTSRAKPSSTASAYTGVSWCSPRVRTTGCSHTFSPHLLNLTPPPPFSRPPPPPHLLGYMTDEVDGDD